MIRQWILSESIQPDKQWLDDEYMVNVLTTQDENQSVFGTHLSKMHTENIAQQIKETLSVSNHKY